MNKYKTFIIALLLFLFSQGLILYAQVGWIQQNTNTSINLLSIRFINQNTGWSVGDSGLILKTTNGGNNWMSSRFGNNLLRSVYFLDENTGIIAGGSSYIIVGWLVTNRYIIRTTNSGNNWNVVMNNNSYFCKNIQFVNDSVGFIPSKGLLKTTDRGISWQFLSGEIDNVYFIDENTGFASNASTPKIFKTIDGGLTWKLLFYTGQYNFGGGVFFNDVNTGYVIGHSTIVKTTNSGITWLSIISNDYVYRHSIYFSSLNHGMVLSNSIESTTNGGNSWNINYSPNLNSVFLLNNDTGWIAGANGKILKTITGGVSDIIQNSSSIPINYHLYQNYPNPFNPATRISFSVAKSDFVSLKLFDISGRHVKTLISKDLTSGSYNYDLNMNEYGSGVYFYELTAGEFRDVKKLMLVK